MPEIKPITDSADDHRETLFKAKERDDVFPLGPDTAEYQAAGGDLDDEIPF